MEDDIDMVVELEDSYSLLDEDRLHQRDLDVIMEAPESPVNHELQSQINTQDLVNVLTELQEDQISKLDTQGEVGRIETQEMESWTLDREPAESQIDTQRLVNVLAELHEESGEAGAHQDLRRPTPTAVSSKRMQGHYKPGIGRLGTAGRMLRVPRSTTSNKEVPAPLRTPTSAKHKLGEGGRGALRKVTDS